MRDRARVPAILRLALDPEGDNESTPGAEGLAMFSALLGVCCGHFGFGPSQSCCLSGLLVNLAWVLFRKAVSIL